MSNVTACYLVLNVQPSVLIIFEVSGTLVLHGQSYVHSAVSALAIGLSASIIIQLSQMKRSNLFVFF